LSLDDKEGMVMTYDEEVYTGILVNNEGEFILVEPDIDCSEEVREAYLLLASMFIQLRDSPAFVEELEEYILENYKPETLQ
jgi:hypothetical protein